MKREKVNLENDYDLDLNVRWQDNEAKAEPKDEPVEFKESDPKKRKLEPVTLPQEYTPGHSDKSDRKKKRRRGVKREEGPKKRW